MLIPVSLLFICLIISCLSKPNVIYILMDDLGFSDIGYNSNEFLAFETPVFDGLAHNGIILNSHYSEYVCSPSRSALFTGRYPWKTTGIAGPLWVLNDASIDPSIPFLSELIKNEGYQTLFVGKWHLGAKSKDILPTNRGFDELLFYFQGTANYYLKSLSANFTMLDECFPTNNLELIRKRNSLFPDLDLRAYDFHGNRNEIILDASNTYNEILFLNKIKSFIDKICENNIDPFFIYYAMPTPHYPSTAPPNANSIHPHPDYELCDHISHEGRNNVCRMMQFSGAVIASIIEHLKYLRIYDNTIIMIVSDNGGHFVRSGFGQNLPLRGTKGNRFEGGIRTPAFITGGLINKLLPGINNGCIYNGLMHISDWFPSILYMIDANVDLDELQLDGINVFKDIENKCGLRRNQFKSSLRTDKSERQELIQMRMNENKEYFMDTMIRNAEYKLIINASTSLTEITHWHSFNGSFTRYPNLAAYQSVTESGILAPLYVSKCYDMMSDAQKVNENNFLVEEVMLFHITDDFIEACNIAHDEQYADIISLLWNRLQEEKENYIEIDTTSRTFAGAFTLFDSYDCVLDMAFFSTFDRFDDDQNLIADDMWQNLIDAKEACDP